MSAVLGVPTTPGIVATFTDADPGGETGDYSATISYGDGGAADAGTIGGDASGWTVTNGTPHTFATAGTFSITVTITDSGGASAVASGTITIALPSIESVTAADDIGGNSVTATGSTSDTLYFDRDSGGNASINVTTLASPDVVASYNYTAYQLIDAGGNIVDSGSLSRNGTDINIPQPAGGLDDSFTLEAGILDNGTFQASSTAVPLLPAKTQATDVTINTITGTTGVSHVTPKDGEVHNYTITSITPAGAGAVAGDIANLKDSDSEGIGSRGNTDVTFTYKGGAVPVGGRSYKVTIQAKGDTSISVTLTITVK